MSTSHDVQPVVVIGANGFLGRRLTQILSGADGLRPIAAARRAPPAGSSGVEFRRCDATDAAAVAAAVNGAAYAVNCVAGNAATMLAATRNLCAAAPTAGVRRVVHLSSMAVYGSATGLVGETHKLDANGGWYGEAKIASEGLIGDYIAAGNDAVILRPGCIHGPHSEQWTGRIARLLQRRRIGDLGAAGDGVCNLIAVDDVAAAVIAAIRRPAAGGEAFNLGDPDPGSWNAYFRRLAQAIGATPVRRIPDRWMALEAKLLGPALKIAQIGIGGGRMESLALEPIPRSLLTLWRQDITLDHRKADAHLGFARTSPDATIASAAAWFRDRLSQAAAA